jgi:hypothetical protein
LPKLKYLLLPVGRSLPDIDIFGLGQDGRFIYGQVTASDPLGTNIDWKLKALKGYGEKPNACSVFFHGGKDRESEANLKYVSLAEVFKFFDSDVPYKDALLSYIRPAPKESPYISPAKF